MDLSNIFTSITTSAIVTGLITLALNTWIKGKINLNYDKKIEKFKDELAELSEQRKLDFERKIHDFSLYSSKKHNVYPEIYKLLLETRLFLIHCNTENEIPLSLRENPRGLNVYLIDMGVPEEKRKELMYNYDINKSNSIKDMAEVIFLLKINDLSKNITKAKDFFYANEIYVSEELSTRIEHVLNNFQLALSQLIFSIDNKEIDFPYSLIDQIELDLKYIRGHIKDELAIADYDFNK
ncbi:MAG TPA: hypothetical protein VNM69_23125 [Bacillus sp. (in: firmicutes)]|nr:hypothetical protein [Bacillus sp. (in: firmicutes)]